MYILIYTLNRYNVTISNHNNYEIIGIPLASATASLITIFDTCLNTSYITDIKTVVCLLEAVAYRLTYRDTPLVSISCKERVKCQGAF